MKIEQLMTRLDASWPFGGPEAVSIATHDYRAVLGKFEGARLFSGWDATIAEWRKGIRPLPADILANVPQSRASDAGKGIDWAAVKAFQAVLIADWWRGNQAMVDEFLSRFADDGRAQRLLDEIGSPRPGVNLRDWMALPASDRAFARSKLADFIRDKAWIEAQRHIMGLGPESIDPTIEDLGRIAGQVASQTGTYPKRAGDLYRPQPRYVRAHPPRAMAATIPEAAGDAPPMPDGRPEPPPSDDGMDAFA